MSQKKTKNQTLHQKDLLLNTTLVHPWFFAKPHQALNRSQSLTKTNIGPSQAFMYSQSPHPQWVIHLEQHFWNPAPSWHMDK